MACASRQHDADDRRCREGDVHLVSTRRGVPEFASNFHMMKGVQSTFFRPAQFYFTILENAVLGHRFFFSPCLPALSVSPSEVTRRTV